MNDKYNYTYKKKTSIITNKFIDFLLLMIPGHIL